KLGDAPADELRAQQGLARAGRAFHQDHVAPEDPAQEDPIQAVDARLDQIAFLHGALPLPCKREWALPPFSPSWEGGATAGSPRCNFFARSNRTARLSAKVISRSKAS